MNDINYFIESISLLIMLLNPFLLIVYLVDLVNNLSLKQFTEVLIRAGIISSIVFILFAITGDYFFSEVLQTRFGSLQIFGGIVLLIIGLQFVFRGTSAIEGLRGEPKHIAGSVAMPIMIGPGTISACMITGERLNPVFSSLGILVSLTITIIIMIGLKLFFDYLKPRDEKLLGRYVEIAGRITALVVGTYAIDLIMNGLHNWEIL